MMENKIEIKLSMIYRVHIMSPPEEFEWLVRLVNSFRVNTGDKMPWLSEKAEIVRRKIRISVHCW